MNIKKVLITGGTGFLGRRLACRLKQMGHSVTATGRNQEIGRVLEEQGISFIQADLVDRDKIVELCRDKDCVFHCGALSSPWGRYKEFYKANVLGTKNIIDGVKQNGVKRLVHVSTTSIYFEFKDKFNLSESLPLPAQMINHYARTKMLAEEALSNAYRDGLPVIIIRPSGIYGPGDTSILPRLIKANNKKFIPVIGDKKVFVDITYVENVVDALLLCMDSGNHTLGRQYNITNGEPIILYEFLEDLIKRLGYQFKPKRIPFKVAYHMANIMEFISKAILFYKEPPLTRYTVGVLTHSKTLDISSAKNDLGYRPRFSIEEGVNQVVKEWNNNVCNN